MGDNNVIPEIQLPPGVEHQDSCEDWDAGVKGAKVKLMRSHAIRDSTSPPPPGYGHNHGQCQPQTVSEGGSERSIGGYNTSPNHGSYPLTISY